MSQSNVSFSTHTIYPTSYSIDNSKISSFHQLVAGADALPLPHRQVTGDVLVVWLVPSDAGDLGPCRLIGCCVAAEHLVARLREDR
jgi:hypothetical protein